LRVGQHREHETSRRIRAERDADFAAFAARGYVMFDRYEIPNPKRMAKASILEQKLEAFITLN
jgi:hypothetical protein